MANYAQSEFQKSQQAAKRDKTHGIVNLIVGVPLIIGCIVLAVRCIH